MPETSAPQDSVFVNLTMTIGNRTLEVRLPMPAGPVLWRETLPGWRVLMQGLTAVAIEQAKDEGRGVSCKAGCGACCRQLVPLAPAEAHALIKLIAELPEPRRTEVTARFAAARAQLAAAGLWDRLTKLAPKPGDPEAGRLSLAFFKQAIACPFLENESCSIHPERPLACREFLVSTDPVHCREPGLQKVEAIALKAHLSSAFSRAQGGGELHYVALPALLEWAETNPEPATRYPTATIVSEVLRQLSGRPPPEPSVAE